MSSEPPRERMLAPSRVLRETPPQTGGGRTREELLDEADAVMERAPQSLRFASRLLDKDNRERASLLYAWARRCDDIAEGRDRPARAGENDSERRSDGVKAIKVLTRRALDGLPTADPAFDGFGLVARERTIGENLAGDVISGFALEAADWVPRTEADLLRYCYHMGGAPAVMLARIMGAARDDGDLLDRACDLGMACELANIARDLSTDDADDRCYIPLAWLAEADLPPGEHLRPEHREKLALLAARIVALMERHEAAALSAVHRLPFRQRWAAIAIARIYGAMGRKVRDAGPAAWSYRTVVTTGEKLRLIAGALIAALGGKGPGADAPVGWTRHEFRPVPGW